MAQPPSSRRCFWECRHAFVGVCGEFEGFRPVAKLQACPQIKCERSLMLRRSVVYGEFVGIVGRELRIVGRGCVLHALPTNPLHIMEATWEESPGTRICP